MKRGTRISKPQNGFFITFEGTEGSGKSTHLRQLAKFLRFQGLKVHCTKEPGGTAIGRAVRRIVLNPRYKNLTVTAELFLMLADRCQHVREVIRPYLKKNYIVLSDRYSDSSLAYQASLPPLSFSLIKGLNRIATDRLEPDLTFLMMSPLRHSLKKAQNLSKEYRGGDRIEKKSLAFHWEVLTRYRNLLRLYPFRMVKIPLESSLDRTQERIRSVVFKKLQRRGFL